MGWNFFFITWNLIKLSDVICVKTSVRRICPPEKFLIGSPILLQSRNRLPPRIHSHETLLTEFLQSFSPKIMLTCYWQ